MATLNCARVLMALCFYHFFRYIGASNITAGLMSALDIVRIFTACGWIYFGSSEVHTYYYCLYGLLILKVSMRLPLGVTLVNLSSFRYL